MLFTVGFFNYPFCLTILSIFFLNHFRHCLLGECPPKTWRVKHFRWIRRIQIPVAVQLAPCHGAVVGCREPDPAVGKRKKKGENFLFRKRCRNIGMMKRSDWLCLDRYFPLSSCCSEILWKFWYLDSPPTKKRLKGKIQTKTTCLFVRHRFFKSQRMGCPASSTRIPHGPQLALILIATRLQRSSIQHPEGQYDPGFHIFFCCGMEFYSHDARVGPIYYVVWFAFAAFLCIRFVVDGKSWRHKILHGSRLKISGCWNSKLQISWLSHPNRVSDHRRESHVVGRLQVL